MGRAGRAVARNQLCALARPDVKASPANLLDLLLDPAVRLGTSTPKADPSGDYAWQLFEKAETLRPGSFAVLTHSWFGALAYARFPLARQASSPLQAFSLPQFWTQAPEPP